MANVIAVTYHYVRNIKSGIYRGLKGLEIEEFEEQIRFLKNNFHILTMEEFLEVLESGGV